MGNASLVFMLFLLPNMVSNKVYISDLVTTDTSFYYRRFETFPSKLATLEYSVTFNITKINRYCNGYECIVILDIYTTEYDKNLKTNCSNDGFGQLRNENLRTPLYLRNRPYRFTTCKLDDKDTNILHCEGRTTIQDYIPRKYGFSFGYECDVSPKPSLFDLSFNFTISEQSNRTQCLRTPQNLSEISCHEFYDYMSLPNMIGDPNMASVKSWAAQLKPMGIFVLYILSQLPTGGCYKHSREVLCHIIFPKCDQVENQVIPPCKETLSDLLHGCLKYIIEVLEAMSSSDEQLFKTWRTNYLAHINISAEFDSDYLPSIADSIPCSYKPVICDHPPNVANARIINNTEAYGTYLAMAQVEYECVNETFQMEGNSSVTCLFSGEWYKMPKCLKRKREEHNESYLNPLIIVIPLLIAAFCIFIVTIIVRRFACRTKKSPILKRNREYDAFVCYNFDEDHLFVFDSILPELEENHDPPLKMFIHDRDFTPGQEITINISNAINNCNSAIIVMSQGFIDSPRCKEEFTKCLAESEEDPAFKLFIILMEEVDTLVNIPENMKIFFKDMTYVKKEDPKLFEKIGNNLWLIRQYEIKDDNMEQEYLFENQDEA